MVFDEFTADLKHHFHRIKDSYVNISAFDEEDEEEDKDKNDELRLSIHQTFTAPLKIEYYFWIWFFYSLYSILKLIIFIPF